MGCLPHCSITNTGGEHSMNYLVHYIIIAAIITLIVAGITLFTWAWSWAYKKLSNRFGVYGEGALVLATFVLIVSGLITLMVEWSH